MNFLIVIRPFFIRILVAWAFVKIILQQWNRACNLQLAIKPSHVSYPRPIPAAAFPLFVSYGGQETPDGAS